MSLALAGGQGSPVFSFHIAFLKDFFNPPRFFFIFCFVFLCKVSEAEFFSFVLFTDSLFHENRNC